MCVRADVWRLIVGYGLYQVFKQRQCDRMEQMDRMGHREHMDIV